MEFIDDNGSIPQYWSNTVRTKCFTHIKDYPEEIHNLLKGTQREKPQRDKEATILGPPLGNYF